MARLRSIKDDKTTETEDMAIAPPDTKGAKGCPVSAKKRPAASGMPMAL